MTDVIEGKRRTALITGASAGIGREIALEFARHGFDVALVARRADRLQALAQEIQGKHDVTAHVVAMDLSDAAAPKRLYDEMRARGVAVDALVNNAGYTVPGFFEQTQWADQAALLQVMVTDVAELCHRFAPDMAQRGYGRIINVASLAGHLPGAPGGTLYAASKSFVIKLSESLSLEYLDHNVHVTALCPGFTYSEFHDVAGNRAEVSQMPDFMWMNADVVAREAVDAVMAGTPVIINGRVNRAIALAVRLMPQRLARALLARNARNATPRAA